MLFCHIYHYSLFKKLFLFVKTEKLVKMGNCFIFDSTKVLENNFLLFETEANFFKYLTKYTLRTPITFFENKAYCIRNA